MHPMTTHRSNKQPRTRAQRSAKAASALGVAASIALVAAAPMLSGCRGALFNDREPRSQYDRYDRSRGEHAPMYVEDEFGIKRPNLSGRLGARD
jgi:hypothetical protein